MNIVHAYRGTAMRRIMKLCMSLCLLASTGCAGCRSAPIDPTGMAYDATYAAFGRGYSNGSTPTERRSNYDRDAEANLNARQ